jgi:cis-3-alkyl-4-acyloxetan-2-one decarboxylase
VNELYPFTDRYFERNGLRLHYLDEGTGEPVVMLHGNPTWSFYYRHLVLGLRDRYRCVAPDHIGCGRSDKPPLERYDYSLSSRVDDLEALLDHLQIHSPITLVLHDWGGMIGMTHAVRHPERVKRLVVLNTAAFHLPAGKRLPWALRFGRNTSIGAWLIRRLNLFCRTVARIGVQRQKLSPAVRAAYLAPYDSWANRIAVLRFVQGIPVAPGDADYELVGEVEQSLAQFRSTPTLICWGMKDLVFDADFLGQWQQHLPQAEVHRFEDAGHYVLEDAGEEIVARVRSFLEAHP